MRNDVLIVNNSEPNVRDYVEPIAVIVRDEGLQVRILEYRDLSEQIVKKHACIILSASPKGDEIALKRSRRPLIKMAPGYVYDAENQVMVKIPSKLAKKRVRPIYARGN